MPAEKDICSCGKCHRILFAPAVNVIESNAFYIAQEHLAFSVTFTSGEEVFLYPALFLLLRQMLHN